MIILGNTVVIRDKTYDYIFMHLHSVDVEINQEVVEGQHIGGVGTTGIYSTGNHLHLGLDTDTGIRLDAFYFIDFSDTSY